MADRTSVSVKRHRHVGREARCVRGLRWARAARRAACRDRQCAGGRHRPGTLATIGATPGTADAAGTFGAVALVPIESHDLQWTPPGPDGADGYRWHAHLPIDDFVDDLVVDLSATEAARTNLGPIDLDARFPLAIERFASARLRKDLPIPEQLLGWSVPVTLRADHFRE